MQVTVVASKEFKIKPTPKSQWPQKEPVEGFGGYGPSEAFAPSSN